MSLTALPPPPRKVRLWHIFFALPAMNGSLPAEQKFRENTETSWYIASVVVKLSEDAVIQLKV